MFAATTALEAKNSSSSLVFVSFWFGLPECAFLGEGLGLAASFGCNPLFLYWSPVNLEKCWDGELPVILRIILQSFCGSVFLGCDLHKYFSSGTGFPQLLPPRPASAFPIYFLESVVLFTLFYPSMWDKKTREGQSARMPFSLRDKALGRPLL